MKKYKPCYIAVYGHESAAEALLNHQGGGYPTIKAALKDMEENLGYRRSQFKLMKVTFSSVTLPKKKKAIR